MQQGEKGAGNTYKPQKMSVYPPSNEAHLQLSRLWMLREIVTNSGAHARRLLADAIRTYKETPHSSTGEDFRAALVEVIDQQQIGSSHDPG